MLASECLQRLLSRTRIDSLGPQSQLKACFVETTNSAPAGSRF